MACTTATDSEDDGSQVAFNDGIDNDGGDIDADDLIVLEMVQMQMEKPQHLLQVVLMARIMMQMDSLMATIQTVNLRLPLKMSHLTQDGDENYVGTCYDGIDNDCNDLPMLKILLVKMKMVLLMDLNAEVIDATTCTCGDGLTMTKMNTDIDDRLWKYNLCRKRWLRVTNVMTALITTKMGTMRTFLCLQSATATESRSLQSRNVSKTTTKMAGLMLGTWVVSFINFRRP